MVNTGAGANEGAEGDTPGEAQLLVSEFPPPPFYYKLAATLQPPPLPREALEKGTKRAAAAASKARAESERMRLGVDTPNTDAILGGESQEEEDDNVVAVFGEIVEDPYLVEVQDICKNPTKLRDEVNRLNREVVQMFIGLVRDLVNRPLENKKRRDELSHNIFLMLQECNKFREHQAREVMIELLEKQLAGRKSVLEILKEEVEKVNDLLSKMEE